MLTNEQIARICHTANKEYCAALGDHTQLEWDEAPEWQQLSAIKGVEFARANPLADPSAQHQAWLDAKAEEGWRYGPVKDPEKKEHPCFLPYYDLPETQQRKDALFRAVVKACTDL